MPNLESAGLVITQGAVTYFTCIVTTAESANPTVLRPPSTNSNGTAKRAPAAETR